MIETEKGVNMDLDYIRMSFVYAKIFIKGYYERDHLNTAHCLLFDIEESIHSKIRNNPREDLINLLVKCRRYLVRVNLLMGENEPHHLGEYQYDYKA